MNIIIVIPTYNEKENISKLIIEIFGLRIENLNVLVVDDNSPDKTAEEVIKLRTTFPVDIIKREKRLGLGSAYVTGFKAALEKGADLVFEMDADFSHDPKVIPRFVEEVGNGADVVVGSRKISGGKVIGWGLWRNFCSNGAMLFSRSMLGLKTKDVTSGYRCYSRKVLEALNLSKIKSNGYAFQEEMIWLCEENEVKIKEIPITFVDRRAGSSKLSWKDVGEFFVNIILLKIGVK